MLGLMKSRRSIRKYTNDKVSQEKVSNIIKAALLAPTAKNSKPCEFIVVKDKALLAKLALAKPGAGFLKDADFGVVVLGDSSISDVWVEDTSIASIYIHLMAAYSGLGSCWIQIRKRNHSEVIPAENYVRGILSIPENINILSIIAIGNPDEQKEPTSEDALDYNKIYLDKYKSAYTD